MKTTKENESPLVAPGRSQTHSTPMLTGATWLLAMQWDIVIDLVSTTPLYDVFLSAMLSYRKIISKSKYLSKYLPIYLK